MKTCLVLARERSSAMTSDAVVSGLPLISTLPIIATYEKGLVDGGEVTPFDHHAVERRRAAARRTPEHQHWHGTASLQARLNLAQCRRARRAGGGRMAP